MNNIKKNIKPNNFDVIIINATVFFISFNLYIELTEKYQLCVIKNRILKFIQIHSYKYRNTFLTNTFINGT